MKRIPTLLVLLGLLLGALAAPSTVQAASPPCPSDPSSIWLYENDGQSGDRLGLCANHSNLNAIPHDLPGNCEDDFLGHENWGNCVDSVIAWIPNGQRLCLYWTWGYQGNVTQIIGPRNGTSHNVPNDEIESIKWTSGAC